MASKRAARAARVWYCLTRGDSMRLAPGSLLDAEDHLVAVLWNPFLFDAWLTTPTPSTATWNVEAIVAML